MSKQTSSDQVAAAPAYMWVAEDPSQPGTAFAFHSDGECHRADRESALADWASKYGVVGVRVPVDEGATMLQKWDKDRSNLKKTRPQLFTFTRVVQYTETVVVKADSLSIARELVEIGGFDVSSERNNDDTIIDAQFNR